MTTTRVGFVGLGSMGAPMAANLLKAGFEVVGSDLRAGAVEDLVRVGGRRAADPAEAARWADLLVLMVVNVAQAEQILFEQGALEALPTGSTVVLMATCPPGAVAALAARVEATGRPFVDAPVSGGVAGAREASLTIMAAAPTAVFRRCEPVLRAMGSRLRHVDRKSVV
jgi:3-hydroxyisobutyrate dehydrogenase